MPLRHEYLLDQSGPPAETADDRFLPHYRHWLPAPCRLAESSTCTEVTDPSRIREKIVRCLWFDQFLEPAELRTEDGRRVRVYSPGYWNTSSGPDFRNAEIAFDDGVRIRGDVEVHVSASDWYRHGHGGNSAYNKVILHVIMYNDRGETFIANGDFQIPQLTLSACLTTDLASILSTLDPDGYPRASAGGDGTCCLAMRDIGSGERRVGRFLDIAGDERILAKSERFDSQMRETTPDDALYGALMEAMGYSMNRRGFRLLADTLPLQQLRRFVPLDADEEERLLVVQSLLYGVSGFLDAVSLANTDAETDAYLDSLRRKWTSLSREIGRSSLDPSVWRLGRMRPTNHPVRRIAGISVFLARHLGSGLCRRVMSGMVGRMPAGAGTLPYKRLMNGLCALFEAEGQSYWWRRTTFGPPGLPSRVRLIGGTRAGEIAVNVLIPLLLALSRQQGDALVEQKLHNVYVAVPPATENSVTRYMKSRIFGDVVRGKDVVRNMRRQQGLLQLYHDFCEGSATTCEDCALLAFIREGKP